ncbi:hypothetical protein C3L33_04303, partial [Rhododendron williamsianum]
MSLMLTTLTKKREVDSIIRDTIDKVLVLRFGRSSDPISLQLDDIVTVGNLELDLEMDCSLLMSNVYTDFKAVGWLLK